MPQLKLPFSIAHDDADHAILYLQFVPSLVGFISLAAFASAGFLVIAFLTLVFGRIYCSSVYPLGTLQDIAIQVQKKRLMNF